MSPTATRAGRVLGVYVVVTDVTQHKLAERAIAESEARFRAIANSAPVLIWVTGADDRREFVNQAYLDFFGGDYEAGARIRLAQGPPSRRPAAHPCKRRRPSSPRPGWSRSRPASAAPTGRGAGCGRNRSRGGRVSGEHAGFIGVAYDVTAAKRARGSAGAG